MKQEKPTITKIALNNIHDIAKKLRAKALKLNKKEKKLYFLCPLCGSKKYETILEKGDFMPTGRQRRIDHFECGRCGVHFSDPESFSKNVRRH